MLFLSFYVDFSMYEFSNVLNQRFNWTCKKSSFTNILGESRFLHKLSSYFQGSRSQNKFQAFQGFQGAVGTLMTYMCHCFASLFWSLSLITLPRRKQACDTAILQYHYYLRKCHLLDFILI